MKRSSLTLVLVFLLPIFGASRCENSAVGDPCVPEADKTYSHEEAPVELSSVQCATRACIVFHLAGNPKKVIGVDPDCDGPTPPDACVTQEEVDQKVYCTCRCDAPAGSNVPTCSCPSGFSCVEILQSGGDGIRGDYCVRSNDPDIDTN